MYKSFFEDEAGKQWYKADDERPSRPLLAAVCRRFPTYRFTIKNNTFHVSHSNEPVMTDEEVILVRRYIDDCKSATATDKPIYNRSPMIVQAARDEGNKLAAIINKIIDEKEERSLPEAKVEAEGKEPLFETGRIVVTRGFINDIQHGDDLGAMLLATNLVSRHVKGDWGEYIGKEDAKLNRDAIKHGDRVFSAYRLEPDDGKVHKVYVITEWDRSLTTVLLAEEY